MEYTKPIMVSTHYLNSQFGIAAACNWTKTVNFAVAINLAIAFAWAVAGAIVLALAFWKSSLALPKFAVLPKSKVKTV